MGVVADDQEHVDAHRVGHEHSVICGSAVHRLDLAGVEQVDTASGEQAEEVDRRHHLTKQQPVREQATFPLRGSAGSERKTTAASI